MLARLLAGYLALYRFDAADDSVVVVPASEAGRVLQSPGHLLEQ